MGCNFPLICGKNPSACCHDCELECNYKCKVEKEICNEYFENCKDAAVGEIAALKELGINLD